MSAHLLGRQNFIIKFWGLSSPTTKTPQFVGFLVRQNFIIKFWGRQATPKIPDLDEGSFLVDVDGVVHLPHNTPIAAENTKEQNPHT